MIGKGSNAIIGYIILASFLLWFLLLLFHNYDLTNFDSQVSLSRIHFLDTYESYSVHSNPNNESKQAHQDLTSNVAPFPSDVNLDNNTNVFAPEKAPESSIGDVVSDSDSCSGRYIYMHNLPSQFNQDLIQHCELLSEWTDMCIFLANFGFGPRLRDSISLSSLGWFHTNQFMLEVIFHNRIKTYKCLTNDSSLASAIFVPYYAGLDVGKYLWDSSPGMKDYNPNSLMKWLTGKPEWKKLWGRDHFMVAGRITWDFRRQTDDPSGWGNKLMVMPESKNMTILTIESSPWHGNDFAIPYPSYFHPLTDHQVYSWQNRTRKIRRKFLFSFIGGPRPNKDTIRANIIQQCRRSRRCKLLECENKPNKCYKPVNVMKFFQTSSFCLQPQGDSYTRRSTFDSILAGCIPVFFHPGSAYVQYLWHLPKEYTKYSVFIPEEEIKNGNTSIERVLNGIPKAKRMAMREQVINLIPGIVYAYPNSSMKVVEDAFDITVNGVIERIDKIRKEIREGKNLNGETVASWKKYLFGASEQHQWDHFFRVR